MKEYKFLYEKVTAKLPTDLKKQIRKKSVRAEMDDSSFLIPDQKKFPVKKPNSKKYDCKLIYAAYLRAKQYVKTKPEYEKVIQKAKQLFNDNKCSIELNMVLKEDANWFQKEEIQEAINELLDPIHTVKFEEISPVDKYSCPSCGYTVHTESENSEFIDTDCPKCGNVKLSININESEYISQNLTGKSQEEKIKFLTEHAVKDNNSQTTNTFICESCTTIINKSISEYNKGNCPKCGNGVVPLYHTIFEDERRYLCPKCNSNYRYTTLTENECSACGSLMTIYEKSKKQTQKS